MFPSLLFRRTPIPFLRGYAIGFVVFVVLLPRSLFTIADPGTFVHPNRAVSLSHATQGFNGGWGDDAPLIPVVVARFSLLPSQLPLTTGMGSSSFRAPSHARALRFPLRRPPLHHFPEMSGFYEPSWWSSGASTPLTSLGGPGL